MSFSSDLDDQLATVDIHRDRIEWTYRKRVSAGKVAAAWITGGLSLMETGGVRRGRKGTGMLPIAAITDVELTTRPQDKGQYRYAEVLRISWDDQHIEFGRPCLVMTEPTSTTLLSAVALIDDVRNGRYSAPVSLPGVQQLATDVTAQLSELARLHSSGALSDEEFAAAKARLLS